MDRLTFQNTLTYDFAVAKIIQSIFVRTEADDIPTITFPSATGFKQLVRGKRYHLTPTKQVLLKTEVLLLPIWSKSELQL